MVPNETILPLPNGGSTLVSSPSTIFLRAVYVYGTEP